MFFNYSRFVKHVLGSAAEPVMDDTHLTVAAVPIFNLADFQAALTQSVQVLWHKLDTWSGQGAHMRNKSPILKSDTKSPSFLG